MPAGGGACCRLFAENDRLRARAPNSNHNDDRPKSSVVSEQPYREQRETVDEALLEVRTRRRAAHHRQRRTVCKVAAVVIVHTVADVVDVVVVIIDVVVLVVVVLVVVVKIRVLGVVGVGIVRRVVATSMPNTKIELNVTKRKETETRRTCEATRQSPTQSPAIELR